MAKVLTTIRLLMEIVWKIAVALINLPIGLVELGWERLFYPERFQESMRIIKNSFNSNGNGQRF